MKKWLKITLGIVGIMILLLIIDIFCIFNINRPLFAIKQDNGNSVNIIYKGIFYDTYFCHDYSSTQVTYKGSKFSCDENIKIEKFRDYDFSVLVKTPTERKKLFAFEHNGIKYYYMNTDYRVYLTEDNYKYDLETSIKNNLVDIQDILNNHRKVQLLWDDGSKFYYYDQFNIIVCGTFDGTNDVLVGDTEMEELEELCK